VRRGRALKIAGAHTRTDACGPGIRVHADGVEVSGAQKDRPVRSSRRAVSGGLRGHRYRVRRREAQNGRHVVGIDGLDHRAR
jgi:hypothetical protein